jgi:hypothetical protein
MRNTILKNSLCAAALIARILKKHKMPFQVVAGYFHMPFMAISFPHVWIETSGGAITDITFSDPSRMISVLGQGFGFQEGAVKPVYTRIASYSVFASSITRDVLEAQARDLEGYLNTRKEDEWIRKCIDETVAIATDGTDKVEIQVDKALLEQSRQPAGGGVGGGGSGQGAVPVPVPVSVMAGVPGAGGPSSGPVQTTSVRR